MTAEDFKPENRLQEAKKDLKEFVSRNPDLEIGLVVFAATAQLLVPITPDHAAVQRALDSVSPAAYGEDGTAIGSGIASAANRLRSGNWPKRSILLITDGVNNRGAISPLDAARLAKELSIPIHALGMGTDGLSRYFVPRQEGGTLALQARIEIDDDALMSLARESGGDYERVRSSQELAHALVRLRPGTPETQSLVTFGPDIRWPQILASLALLLLGVEFILTHFVFSELPG
jgi:Ca-activated chloride channel family protein